MVKRKMIICMVVLSSCNGWEKDYRARMSSQHFWGTIDTAYLDPEDRMQPVAILNNGIKYSIGNSVYKKFNRGDTVYKPSGTMKYYWIKNGDSVIFYQRYGKYDLTDSGRVFNPNQEE